MGRKKGFDFFSRPQQDVTITTTLNDFFLRPSQELPLHRYILNHDEVAALAHIEQYRNSEPSYLGNYNENASKIALPSSFGYITINGDTNHRYYRSEDKNDIFLQNEAAESPLHLAVREGMPKVVVALLAHGAPIDLIDGYGDTPLHLAAKIGNEELIALLVMNKASTTLRERRTNARAIDLLNENRTYSIKTIELLLHYDPIKTNRENYKATPLHHALLQDADEDEIKTLCQRIDNLIPNEHGERPSVLAQRLDKESKLVSFLHILEICLSLTIDYTACMSAIKHRERMDSDREFLRISIELIKELHSQFSIWEKPGINKWEAPSSTSSSSAMPKETELACALDFIHYNQDVLKNVFDLFASCIHHISFSLRDKTCDIFPWKNIRALRYLAFRYKENDATATLLLDRLGKHFIIDLPTIIGILEEKILNSLQLWETLPSKKDKKDMRIVGLDSIYALTEPIIAERTLYKISNVCLRTQSFSEASLQGRYAIMRAIKMLCEMSLYTHTSRNLSGLVKSFFPSVPWKELRQLRIFLAKNVIIFKAYTYYESLLEGQDNTPFTLAKTILLALYNMAQKAIVHHNEHLEKIELGNYHFDEFKPTYTLSVDSQDALLKAIDIAYKQKGRKAQGKSSANFTHLKQCIEKNILTELAMKDIVNFFPARSTEQVLWRKNFDSLKKDLGVFKTFLDTFGLSNNTHREEIEQKLTQKDYANIGLKIIKRLEEILIGSSDIILELEQVKNLSALSQKSQVFILNRLKIFKENIEFHFCCEQLITDLCTAISETPISYNKQLRNYLEHIDDIFETAGRDIVQGNFFEMIDCITDVKTRLITHFGIDFSSELNQQSKASSVAPVNTPQFNTATENLFFGIFSRRNNSISDQTKQKLQNRYKLTSLNELQLAKGLRNAAANGKLDDLKIFIELNVDINATDPRQHKTALHHALEKRHMHCVDWLIEKGADCSIADITETTAYDYARQNGLTIREKGLKI